MVYLKLPDTDTKTLDEYVRKIEADERQMKDQEIQTHLSDLARIEKQIKEEAEEERKWPARFARAQDRARLQFFVGGIGGVLAMIISYDVNHSILLAILHLPFSWLYVAYAAIAH